MEPIVAPLRHTGVSHSTSQDATSARADRHAAFVGLYRDSYKQLVQVARMTTGSTSIGEELVQDAFVDLYRHLQNVENPAGYVRRAVVSRCTSWVRRQTLERRYVDWSQLTVAASLEPDAGLVMDVVSRLPPRQKAVIVMRYVADWSERDMAQALGCRPGTIKSLLARARSRIAQELNDEL